MSGEKRTYFFNDGHDTFKVEIDKELVNSLGGERSKRFEDFMTGVLNGVLEGTVRASALLFKFGEMPHDFYKIHMFKLGVLTLGIDYGIYFKEGRKQYGNNGGQDHMVAITQAIIGALFADLGLDVGFLLGTSTPWGLAGAIAASIVYDVKDIGGKTPSEWVGDAARNIIHEFSQGDFFKGENNGAIILGLGLQILLEAQARGHIFSMQNSNFVDYARARAQDLRSSFGGSNGPTSAPTPPTNAPAKRPTSGPSAPPTNSPTKGPSGSGPMPTGRGSSSSNQAPFTSQGSTPTRAYTGPSTTPANTPPSFTSSPCVILGAKLCLASGDPLFNRVNLVN